MKKILVLTDSSENAAHAAKSAVMFGKKLHADILLLNNMVGIPVTPYNIGGGFVAEEVSWVAEDSRKHIHELTGCLEASVNDLDPTEYKPTIHHLITEGSLGENVGIVAKQQLIELVVMGAKTGGFFNHLLSGNDTQSVINYATCPVLMVPLECDLEKVKKVVFATDYKRADIKAVQFLARLGEVFDFQLEIVHVSQFGKQEETDDQNELAFVSQMAKLKYPKIVYKDVRGKDIITRLNRLCEETSADLLALVHYPHSFFGGLLQNSYTQKVIDHQDLPLLVFSGDIEKR